MPDKLRVATISAHFNILREQTTIEGPVTIDEQIGAVGRFVRWHKRQVEVGEKLLDQLLQFKETGERKKKKR